MATVKLNTAHPPTFINAYIIGQLEEFGILTGEEQFEPIVPVTSTNIDDLYANYIGSPGDPNPLLIIYDRLLRFRPSPFYRTKREQLIYTVHSANESKVFDTIRVMSEALDRSDATGQDINSYIISNPVIDKSIPTNDPSYPQYLPHNVFFHNVRVYQADESRDLIELSSVRTIYRNKLIIEYDYHTKDSYYN